VSDVLQSRPVEDKVVVTIGDRSVNLDPNEAILVARDLLNDVNSAVRFQLSEVKTALRVAAKL